VKGPIDQGNSGIGKETSGGKGGGALWTIKKHRGSGTKGQSRIDSRGATVKHTFQEVRQFPPIANRGETQNHSGQTPTEGGAGTESSGLRNRTRYVVGTRRHTKPHKKLVGALKKGEKEFPLQRVGGKIAIIIGDRGGWAREKVDRAG